MKLLDILPKLLEGKKITRRLWPEGAFLCVDDITIDINGKKYKLDERSMQDDDWYVKGDEEGSYYKDIVQSLLFGFGCRRLKWNKDDYIYLNMDNGCVYLKNSEGCNLYTPRKDDFLYEDWVSIIILKGRDDE